MRTFLVILAILAIAAPAMATNSYDGPGDWSTGANWTGGLPVHPDAGTLNIRSGTCTIDTEIITDANGFLMIGHNDGGLASSATLAMTGGQFATSAGLEVYGANNGDYTLELSGSANMDLGGYYFMMYYGGEHASGSYTTSTSTITMSDSSTLDIGGTLLFGAKHAPTFGAEGSGQEYRVNLSGTSVLTVASIAISDTTPRVRALDLAGGSLRVAGDVTLPEGPGYIVVSGYGENAGGGEGVAYTKTWDGTYSIFAGIDGTAIPADFDSDNDVDGIDFGLWQTGYPTASGATLGDGDADGDGDVDGIDFGIWQANYPTNVGGAAAIPEPATLGLLLIGSVALLKHRRQ